MTKEQILERIKQEAELRNLIFETETEIEYDDIDNDEAEPEELPF